MTHAETEEHQTVEASAEKRSPSSDRSEETAAEQTPAAGETTASSSAATEPATEPDAGRHEAELARLEAELEEVRDLARRKQAEFENYRKRVDRERQEFTRFANAELVKEILPVLDNLERALGAADSGSENRFQEGVEIISRQFRDILARAGLREVEAQGKPFDPHVHEAVGQIETDEHADGTVVDVLQKGYFLNDRLLRPALVNVAHGAGGDSGEKQETEDAAPNDSLHSDAQQS